MATTKGGRSSILLTADEQAELARLRVPGTSEREALSRVSGMLLAEDASDDDLLHALLTAGHLAVAERVMVNGYAALADAQDDTDHAAHHAIRRRAACPTG